MHVVWNYITNHSSLDYIFLIFFVCIFIAFVLSNDLILAWEIMYSEITDAKQLMKSAYACFFPRIPQDIISTTSISEMSKTFVFQISV